MDSFSNLKKESGLSTQQLVQLTGYTRQGLYNAFKMIDEGKEPSKQFFKCMEAALRKKIEDETKEFTQRITNLNQLRHKFDIPEEG